MAAPSETRADHGGVVVDANQDVRSTSIEPKMEIDIRLSMIAKTPALKMAQY
jgi:hypothetical protein